MFDLYNADRQFLLFKCAAVTNQFTPVFIRSAVLSVLKKTARFYGWVNKYHYIWKDDPALCQVLLPLLHNTPDGPTLAGHRSSALTAANEIPIQLSSPSWTKSKSSEITSDILSSSLLLIGALAILWSLLKP